MNSLIYCWRLQEVNPAYWGSNISQEQYKAFHTRAECPDLNTIICKDKRSKVTYFWWRLTKGTSLGNYLDFSTRGAKGEGDAEVDERYVVLFCKKSQ